MAKLRLAFMGTPDFAVPALRALGDAGHDVIAVYSQPPKPVGRGRPIQKTPVHRLGEDLGIEVRTPRTLRDAEEQEKFAKLNLDAAIVAAYGLILPKSILTAPRLGCINIHASLLPRWRGAAPIQRAMLAGDKETGITIMQMDEGLDTGAMLLQEKLPITATTTVASLHDTLAEMGARLITKALDGLAAGAINPTPQPETGITYAAKLTREDGRIQWSKPAMEIERQIRSLQPWPGSFFMLEDEPIKVMKASVVRGQKAPSGTLLDADFTVACGEDALRLETVQRTSKAAIDGASFLRGARLEAGLRL